ncbi:LysR family transcriptional regulator [Xanthomonas hortorum]|uniref:LysR family transcriptional regulator n=1 Tax=Xanthomonas hortorum TaxID=56454 RepID=UPI0001FD6B72|nr:LysR family transcriptional regulator [Xanthomonas hortorum]EGD21018.1 transcriptional regulator [Xanthomonas hortorum ATCC 19865]
MIDLNDIALYVQVVRSGSFAEAARRLGTAPNSVSRRVQQLEAQLDTRLMQRSTRKLTLTDAGQAFFERSADAVDGLTSAGQSLVAWIFFASNGWANFSPRIRACAWNSCSAMARPT